MPCRQASTYNGTTGSGKPGGGGYTTEAECLQACKEGACCEGTTCSVKPQCQCQGTGKTFKGVGTTCSPNPCLCCSNGNVHPSSLLVEIVSVSWVPDNISLSFSLVGSYVVPFGGCISYDDSFFANSLPCSTAAVACFTGCTTKLRIIVTTASGTYQVFFRLCDYDGTLDGSRYSVSGEVWGYIPGLEQKICDLQFPIEGTTTQRNNPNFGGSLNAITYRISPA